MEYDPQKIAKEAADANWADFFDAITTDPNVPVLFCSAGARKAIDNAMVFKAKNVKHDTLEEGQLYSIPFSKLATNYSPEECTIWMSEVARMCGDLDINVFISFILKLAENIKQGNLINIPSEDDKVNKPEPPDIA